ncbi:MAG TPA: PAS domain-containing protein, partial [Gammaproteobacteria bacterium]|nr:PAS domain-containing protein [Gammaproteobacteria bacterium]
MWRGELFGQGGNPALPEACSHEAGLADGIIEALPGVFLLADQTGRLHRWNRNLERVTGYDGEEIEGRNLAELLRREGRQRMQRCLEQAFESGSSSTEVDLRLRIGG